jgi:hypothetical protein
LHLKWGEALVYAGKRVEAKAQFARAGQLLATSQGNSIGFGSPILGPRARPTGSRL